MRRALVLSAVLSALAWPAAAQTAVPATPAPATAAPAEGRTLADLRADLKALAAELKALRAELNASGAAGFQAAGGDSAIDRMNAMERDLARLTGEAERLRKRIDQVVRDGTNRIGDIEFRLCEMEDGCDLGALTTPTLGDQSAGTGGVVGGVVPGVVGGPVAAAGPATGHPAGADPVTPSAGVPLTAAERRSFDAASAAMQQGDFPRAAELFAAFARTHADSPAAAEAQFLRGAALDSAGDAKGATAAWLSAFAAAPTGPRAADALLGLSRVAAVGKAPSAGCVYLTELITRFAGTPQADEAERRSTAANCAAAMQGEPAAMPPDADADPAADPAAEGGADPEASADPEAAADLADGG
ncbi:tetratricopeptide repeat protein [Paracoccus sanguinis]|uniref:tetratricopeptide repeat protein n=1 Tax=Paracoccus sanguinis TaxID=1545044 RepID=UPI00145252C1|nr:tetratricopeptide repeat protein [Paracoccus sanguinis]QJD16417.1 tetratricopeptide repeat protein [Paracoccus sanguinis]